MDKFKFLTLAISVLLVVGILFGCTTDNGGSSQEGLKTLQVGVYGGEGGQIKVGDKTATSEEGINKDYDLGDEVTLKAYPGDNYQFIGWKDAEGNKIESYSSKEITVEMNTDKTFLAAFTKIEKKTLTVGVDGGQGGQVKFDNQIVTSGEGINKDYDIGTKITLKASPADNYQFVRWEDAEGNKIENYSSQEITVEMKTDKSFFAVFSAGEVTFSGVKDMTVGKTLDITSNISGLKDTAGNNLSGDYNLTVHSNLDGQVHSQESVTFQDGTPQDTVKIAADKLTTAGTHTLTVEVNQSEKIAVAADTIEANSGVSQVAVIPNHQEQVSDLVIENQNQAGDKLTIAGDSGVYVDNSTVEFIQGDGDLDVSYSYKTRTLTIYLSSTPSDNTSTNIAGKGCPVFSITATGDATASDSYWEASQPDSQTDDGGSSKFEFYIDFEAAVNKDTINDLTKYSLDVDGDGTPEFSAMESVEYVSDSSGNYVKVTTETIENIENAPYPDISKSPYASKFIVKDIKDEYGNIINAEKNVIGGK